MPQSIPLKDVTSHTAEAGCLGEPEGHRLEYEQGSTLTDLSWGFIAAPFLPPNLLQWCLMLHDCNTCFLHSKSEESWIPLRSCTVLNYWDTQIWLSIWSSHSCRRCEFCLHLQSISVNRWHFWVGIDLFVENIVLFVKHIAVTKHVLLCY